MSALIEIITNNLDIAADKSSKTKPHMKLSYERLVELMSDIDQRKLSDPHSVVTLLRQL